MSLRTYLLLVVVTVSMFSPILLSDVNEYYLKIVVCTLSDGKIVPKVIFKPHEIAYILCEYRPFLRKSETEYYCCFSYFIEVLDPINRRMFYKNNTVRTKVGENYVWKTYYSFQIRSSFYNGIYLAKITVHDFFAGKSFSSVSYFAVVESVPAALTLKATHSFRLGNPHKTNIKIDYLYVALITSNIYQKVVKGPVFSKNPLTMVSDIYGNKYAVYKDIKLAPGENFLLNINYTLVLKTFFINLNVSRDILKSIPANITIYLKPGPKIESDHPLIREKALELTEGKKTLLEMLYSIGCFVKSHITYTQMKVETSALQAYLSRKGDCTEYSMLFTALARAAGIPCRMVAGYGFIYFLPSQKERNITTTHAWCEVYVPNVGWVPVEPQAPGSIGSSAPAGYYIVLCRCPNRNTTLYGNKIKIKMLYRVFSGLYSTVQYSLNLHLIDKESIQIKITLIKYSKGYISVSGWVNKNIDKLKAIILKPNNSTKVIDIFVKNKYFSLNYRAYDKGLYRICLFYAGSEKYKASYTEINVFTEKEKSSITVHVDRQKVIKGEAVTITGQLNPPLSNQIILVKCVKGKQIFEYFAKTRGGKFKISVKLPSEGLWTIIVYWNGSVDYYSCKATVMVEVVSPPSLLEQVLEYKELIAVLILVLFIALLHRKIMKKSK